MNRYSTMQKIIYILAILSGLVFTHCSKEKVDTVENNENEVREEAVAGFDYQEVKGVFKGVFKGKQAVLNLDDTEYSLSYEDNDFKGKYYSLDAGSMIELEYMEYQSSLPFSKLKIEDPTFLVIYENNEPTEYYLEKDTVE